MHGNGATARAAVRTESALRPATSAPPSRVVRMVAAAIHKGPKASPRRYLVYGVEGIGKSTIAAAAPKPIFLCAEDGVDELDVARLPEPRSWQDVLDAFDLLLTQDLGFETLVVDTVDWLEPLLFAHLCKKENKGSITDFKYGDGYKASTELWRIFTARCDELRQKRGMAIVLIGHSMVKEFKDPTNDAYERYQLKIYKDSAGWLREWCDAVLFANYDVATKENKRGRVRAFDSGARFFHAQRTAAYDAKNRLNLPPRVPFSWEALQEAISQNAPATPDVVRRRLDGIAPRLGTDDQTKLAGAIERVGDDAVKLMHLFDWATARVAIAEDEDVTEAVNPEPTQEA
jgi:hypothetical protein